jgi:hypothetical protein
MDENISYIEQKLRGMKVADIRQFAKMLDIKGRWDMTKDQLIQALLEKHFAFVDLDGVKSEAKAGSFVEDEAVRNDNDITEANNSGNFTAGNKEKEIGKARYLKNIEAGVLIAYNDNEIGVMKSAKVMRVSQRNKKLKVLDYFGKEYVINFSQVVWVKTGKRWPRKIYNLIKRGSWHETLVQFGRESNE